MNRRTVPTTALLTLALAAGCASQPPRDGGPPVQVVAVPPPGYGVAAGAATGAIIGAAVSQPWDTAEGAVLDYRSAMTSCLAARGYAVR